MAKRTLTQMLAILSRNLEDDANNLFTAAEKTDFLNEAQQETIIEVPMTSLPELFTETTAQVIDSSNRFDLTNLSETVSTQTLDLLRFPDGVISMRITDGAFVHLITQIELERLAYMNGLRTNFNRLFSVNDPRFTFEGNEIEILMTQDASAETLDFKWYRKPVEMVISPNVDSELQDYIQLATIDLATSRGFTTEDQERRDIRYLRKWERRIDIINGRFPKTQSLIFQKRARQGTRGVGTQDGVTFV